MRRTLDAHRRPPEFAVVEDSGPVTADVVAGDADEDAQPARLLQQHGFISRPPDGSEGVVVYRHGRSNGRVVVACDSGFRLELDKGEVAMVHEDGAKVVLTNDGDITIVPGPAGFVRIGEDNASRPTAFGDVVQRLISALWQMLQTMGPVGNLGVPVIFGTDAVGTTAEYGGGGINAVSAAANAEVQAIPTDITRVE